MPRYLPVPFGVIKKDATLFVSEFAIPAALQVIVGASSSECLCVAREILYDLPHRGFRRQVRGFEGFAEFAGAALFVRRPVFPQSSDGISQNITGVKGTYYVK